MRKRKIAEILAAVAAALGLALLPAAGAATAAITPVCENGGGNQPPGQQDRCNGQGLTEENQNPAGHAPPGQNK